MPALPVWAQQEALDQVLGEVHSTTHKGRARRQEYPRRPIVAAAGHDSRMTSSQRSQSVSKSDCMQHKGGMNSPAAVVVPALPQCQVVQKPACRALLMCTAHNPLHSYKVLLAGLCHSRTRADRVMPSHGPSPGDVCFQPLPHKVLNNIHGQGQGVLLRYTLLLGTPDHAVPCIQQHQPAVSRCFLSTGSWFNWQQCCQDKGDVTVRYKFES